MARYGDAIFGRSGGNLKRGCALCLAAGMVPGLLLCGLLFDWSFVTGQGPYWADPRGIVGGGEFDQAISMGGYFHFVRDNWRFPLFHVATLGAPGGNNILLADSIPALALVGRLWYLATSDVVNLFGLWAVACFVLNGVAFTAMTRAMGLRTVSGALASAAIGVSMPILLARWGHPALCGQFVIPLAIALHVRRLDPVFGAWRGWSVRAGLLAVLSLLINPYLCAMVVGILFAALAQNVWTRPQDRWRPAAAGLMLAALLAVTVWGGGFLATGFIASPAGYGVFGMNLASPLFPQMSGAFPAAAHFMIDGTGGQHEGFAYLGAGVLLLLVVAFSPGMGSPKLMLRRFAAGFLLMAAFVLFAISHEIYFFKFHLGTIPLPGAMLDLADIFRASGRFVWPACIAVTGGAVTAVGLRFGGWGAAILLSAALLQWVDTAPLRAKIMDSVATMRTPVLAEHPWRAVISRHQAVSVLPSPNCAGADDDKLWALRIKIVLQRLTGLEAVAIERPQLARTRSDCPAEDAAPRDIGADSPILRVYLPGYGTFAGLGNAVRDQPNCRAWPDLVVCAAASVDLPETLRPVR